MKRKASGNANRAKVVRLASLVGLAMIPPPPTYWRQMRGARMRRRFSRLSRGRRANAKPRATSWSTDRIMSSSCLVSRETRNCVTRKSRGHVQRSLSGHRGREARVAVRLLDAGSREGAIDQHIAFSKSADRGRTWSAPKLLCDRDGGKPFLHPRSPVPFYDWKGPEAGSGTYFALIHNAFDFNGKTAYQRRGPLYLIAGTFMPTDEQPVWFKDPKLFAPREDGNSFSPSTRVISCWTARACCGAMTRSSISAAASSAPNGLTD